MSKIFDNIGSKFEEGLHAILTNAGVERADFCVGYFNLRGWKQVAADIEKLPGGDALEKNAKAAFRERLPHDDRDEIERAFAAAAKDASLIKPLGRLLKAKGLFELYQDRFFALLP